MLGGIKCIPHSSPEEGLGGMVVPANPLFSEPGNYQMSDVNQLWEKRKQDYIRTTDLCTIIQNACGKYVTYVIVLHSDNKLIAK